MEKKLLTLSFVGLGLTLSAQLTYVGEKALVHIQDQALVYSGGGVKVDADAKVNTIGDFMVVTSTGNFEVASTADFRLKYSSASVYGQLYIRDMPQGNITGKVNKEYVDVKHGTTGRQQVALPFYNYGLTDLQATLPHINISNSALTASGRWNRRSVFKWNNTTAAFDQLTTALPKVGNATDYYILSRRLYDGTEIWNTTETAENNNANLQGYVPASATDLYSANSMKKIFKGLPVSDKNTADTEVTLSGSFTGDFGTNGTNRNAYREIYNTYVDDPFYTNKWGADYGKNLYQYGNPYLTNLDISKINQNESNGDGVYVSNIKGFYMYQSGILNSINGGTNYSGTTGLAVTYDSSALPVGAVLSDLMVKPMQEFLIKLKDNTSNTINFNNLRRFSQTPRTATSYSVTAAKVANPKGRTASKVSTKQLMVLLTDENDTALSKLFYVVNEEATTGYAPEKSLLQATSEDATFYTKEELPVGGADANAGYKLYINEANEFDFKGKEISLVVNSPKATKLKFFLIEAGNLLETNGTLSNGKSFYFGNNGTLTKINSGDTLPLENNNFTYGLYYEQPTGTLETSELVKGNTVIAKKENSYVVIFNKNWKHADIEVYSPVGQLLHSAKKVSTYDEYKLPIDYSTNGVYIVKVKSDEGEVVTKKIIK